MPSLGIAPHPGGLRQAIYDPAAETGAGVRRLSGGLQVAPSGDWTSGNSAFAVPRGSP